MTEAELNSASVGTGSNEVLQRQSIVGSNSVTFDTTRQLVLLTFKNISSSDVWNATFDEIQFSDSGLNELTAIPEPSSVSLILAAVVGGTLLLRRRRR